MTADRVAVAAEALAGHERRGWVCLCGSWNFRPESLNYGHHDVLREHHAHVAAAVVAALDAQTGDAEQAFDRTGPWFHDDGTRCPIFLASKPDADGVAWWCTEHQQHVHVAPGDGEQAGGLTEGDRADLEAACLAGLVDTPNGWRYRPSKGADAVLAAGFARTAADPGDDSGRQGAT